jgi:hypothetical protein
MSDIVSELLDRAYSHKPNDFLCERAAMEIERLRDGAVAGCETVCPHVRGTVTQYCSLNFTLTDEERAAIEDAAGICEEHAEEYDGTDSSPTSATLRSLLARLA